MSLNDRALGPFCPSVFLASEGTDIPHHTPFLDTPEEGQTGRARSVLISNTDTWCQVQILTLLFPGCAILGSSFNTFDLSFLLCKMGLAGKRCSEMD